MFHIQNTHACPLVSILHPSRFDSEVFFIKGCHAVDLVSSQSVWFRIIRPIGLCEFMVVALLTCRSDDFLG